MNRKIFVIMAMMMLTLMILPTDGWSAVRGSCSDCHTMHNSQNGSVVAAGGPYRALTIGECVACHTGDNDGTNNIPYVMSSAAPTYGPDWSADGTFTNIGDTLAGGSFYWVAAAGGIDDATGHNVSNEGLCGTDGAIGNTPPGFLSGWGTTGIGADWGSNQLTCAGTYGCHGDHTYADDFASVSGGHHGDDSVIDGTTVAKSYRFLKGILGLEYNTGAQKWEYQPTVAAHNQYKGAYRTEADTIPTLGAGDGTTISFFCGSCHSDYHSGVDKVAYSNPIGDDPWLRHPTDYDMGSTLAGSEYRGYYAADGSTQVTNNYNVIATVASDSVVSVISSVAFDNDTAIVTCLSCHRAHGSPYSDLLRWDYTKIMAGADAVAGWDNKGCFACHTSKD